MRRHPILGNDRDHHACIRDLLGVASITADDSKAYTKPWTAGPVKLAWHPDWELVEAFCLQEDNSAFKKLIMDPSWAHGQAPNGNKADKKSDPKTRP